MTRNLATALALWALAIGSSATAADWFHWRGPWQTGVSPDKNLPSKLVLDPKDPATNLVWKAPYGCRSTPLVMNGRVYLINYVEEAAHGKPKAETIQERVVCLDAKTGKLVWEHKFNVFHADIVTVRLGWTNLAGDPATGNVYAHGTAGLLFCFDKDGKINWSRSLSEEFGRISGYGGRLASPVVEGNLVVIGMLNSSWGDQGKGGCRFLAMDKSNGKIVWWSEPGAAPKDTFYCVPVPATINGQRLLIVGGADGGVYAIKASTGEKVWGHVFGTGAINSSPVVDGSLVYIAHGEENPDNAVQGRVICLDGSVVKDGQPKLVWQKDGVKARYASPILHEGRLYIPDDISKLYCLDAKNGDFLWKKPFSYGRNSRGSPVLADGKIYVGDVSSKFVILEPGPKSCKKLDEVFFPSTGVEDIELNGTPAIADGKLFFATSDDIYCVAEKNGKSEPWTSVAALPPVAGKKIAHLQVFPADVTLHPGESADFALKFFDENGEQVMVKPAKIDWSLPAPPVPPGAKAGPPPLKGEIADGKLTVDAKMPAQQGYVSVKVGDLVGRARVRVAPTLPYSQDFEKIPDGAVPAGWINAQGKFLVKTVNGVKLLAKVNDKASPLVAKGNGFITLPTATGYTIECDVQGSQVGGDLPDMGVVANRYTLVLSGNIQKLRIVSWDALPRVDKTVQFSWKPGVWYRLKLTVETKGDSAVVKGKAWPRDEAEPAAWTAETTDSRPNREGSAALYGYVTGIPDNGAGTDVFYDNLRVAPNKK